MAYARITLLPAQHEIAAGGDESILDAARRAGINLPHSCKGGHCASCRARLVEGAIRYPDMPPAGLTEQEHHHGDVLLCQARAASAHVTVRLREIHAPVDLQVKSLPCRVEQLQQLAPDVMAMFLKWPAAEDFAYLPGQYIDVLLPQQRRRSFSIANAPGRTASLELHVGRVAGGEFTQQVFEAIRPGTLLRMEGPLGQFWFRQTSPRPALLIAGGTGYAPMRAMLEALLGRGEERPLHLYWGVRTPEQLYEQARLHEWTQRHANFRYTPVVSGAAPSWQGRTGLVHAAALQDHDDFAALDVYTAGPPALVEAVRYELVARGLPAEQLFFDSFDFAPDARRMSARQELS